MAVKNVECQLAEMQIGRFVSGEALSAEAIKQLDAHLAVCANCNTVLNDRRKALKSMLNQGYAAVTTDIPTARKENLLIKALAEKATTAKFTPPRRTAVEASPEPATSKKRLNPVAALTEAAKTDDKNASLKKTLIYSAALGIVLFAMGYLSHGQGGLLGDSAAQSYPAQAPTSAPADSTSTVSTPPKSESEAEQTPKPKAPAKKHSASKPLTAASDATPSGTSTPVANDAGSSTTDSSKSPNDNTSTDASESPIVPAKAVVHHPRKYVPAAHKRRLPIRRVVRQRRSRPVAHHHATKPARAKWGVRIYGEDGKPIN
jgi:hypothetical protein